MPTNPLHPRLGLEMRLMLRVVGVVVYPLVGLRFVIGVEGWGWGPTCWVGHKVGVGVGENLFLLYLRTLIS